jgi:hypothetical protein
MKIVYCIVLLLAASPAFATHKCVVNGKTTYQQTICAKGQSQPISGGTLSSVDLKR